MASININVAIGKQSDKKYKFRDVLFKINQEKNEISDSKDLRAIQQGIVNIFTWGQYERIIQPDFPGNFSKFKYSQMDNVSIQNIKNEIISVFEKWEPRVKILTVDIIPRIEKNTMLIHIKYSVPTLSTEKFNIEVDI